MPGEIRRRLGPPPELPDWPRVSIVVVSHDGAEHLRTLVRGLTESTDYPELELIAVDNGSDDDSLDFLRSVAAPFPISIVANPHNESFSDANNQGAARARGELLLFLNNDIEPFESGWLRELAACRRAHEAGAVGATLLFPHEDLDRFPHGFAVQHRGLTFRDEDATIAPALRGWEADPLDAGLGDDAESAAVVAACLLVDAQLFKRLGGFTHGFFYGAEDIDFALKLREAGRPILCSGRSLLIHRPGSTRRTVEFERARERKLRNRRLLLSLWGPRLRREHDLAALAGGGMWVQPGREQGALASTSEEAAALTVCAKATDPPGGDGRDPLEELCANAAAAGRRCLALRGEAVDDPRGLECDVAIHLRGPQRYLPAPGQFNVLWIVGSREDLSAAECDRYDLVMSGDGRQAIRLQAASAAPVIPVSDSAADALAAALAAAQRAGRPTRIGPARREARDAAVASDAA